jgi:hypothetical protein
VFAPAESFQHQNEMVLTETNIMHVAKCSNAMTPFEKFLNCQTKTVTRKEGTPKIMVPLQVFDTTRCDYNSTDRGDNGQLKSKLRECYLNFSSESASDEFLDTLSLSNGEFMDTISTTLYETHHSSDIDYTCPLHQTTEHASSPEFVQLPCVESCDFVSAADVPNISKTPNNIVSPIVSKRQHFGLHVKSKDEENKDCPRDFLTNVCSINFEKEACQPIARFPSLHGIFNGSLDEDSSVVLTSEDCFKWAATAEANEEEESLSFRLCHCLYGGLDSEESVVIDDDIEDPTWYIVLYWVSWVAVFIFGMPILVYLFGFLNAESDVTLWMETGSCEIPKFA